MDPKDLAVDEKKKLEVEKLLVETIALAYKEKKFSYADMKKAASYILDHIDKVKTYGHLTRFLTDLTFYWPLFKNVLVIEKERETKDKEQEIIGKLSSYIKSFQVQ